MSGMSGSRPRPYAPPVRGQLPPARGQLPAPPFGSSPSLLAALPRASSGFGFLRPLPDRQGEPLLRVQASTSGRASPCSWLRSSPDGSIGAVGPTALFVSSWPWTIRLGLGRVVIDLLHLPGAGRGGEALHLDAAAGLFSGCSWQRRGTHHRAARDRRTPQGGHRAPGSEPARVPAQGFRARKSGSSP